MTKKAGGPSDSRERNILKVAVGFPLFIFDGINGFSSQEYSQILR